MLFYQTFLNNFGQFLQLDSYVKFLTKHNYIMITKQLHYHAYKDIYHSDTVLTIMLITLNTFVGSVESKNSYFNSNACYHHATKPVKLRLLPSSTA